MIRNHAQFEMAVEEASRSLDAHPAPNTAEGQRLSDLLDDIEAYRLQLEGSEPGARIDDLLARAINLKARFQKERDCRWYDRAIRSMGGEGNSISGSGGGRS